MNVTPWPIKTLSSMLTPSQMNVWLEILHLLRLSRFSGSRRTRRFRIVPYFAAIEINEFRKLDAFAELDVVGNRQKSRS